MSVHKREGHSDRNRKSQAKKGLVIIKVLMANSKNTLARGEGTKKGILSSWSILAEI